MLYIERNRIIVTSEYQYYDFLRKYLIKVYLDKHVNYFAYMMTANEKTKYNIPEIDAQIDSLNNGLRGREFDKCDCFYKPFYLYELDDNDNMIIPIGYLDFIKPYIIPNLMKINYKIENPMVNTERVLERLSDDILPGITLRPQQMEGIKRGLRLKKTLLQLATGAGKTEIMCGIVELLRKELGKIPTTLIIEPTDKLKKEIIDRFNKYKIDAVDYNKDRCIIEHKVNIAHPSSINIDIKKDEHLLDNVKVYFQDEAHHIGSDSNSAVVMNVINAEYIIGVSASIVGQDHINSKNLQEYSVDELKSLAMVGMVSYNVTAKDLIKEGKLAEPVLLVVNNPADEKLPKDKQNDWHTISRIHLQSLARIKYISQVATYFSKKKRKTLILVNNKNWAQNICKCIHDFGYGDECRLSFGGQIFLQYNNKKDSFDKDKETFDKFRSGEVSILIGTQHLIEGVDVPSLDCVILPSVGKSERIQIQSCGRALRVTKNGNMAYIVDFSDEKNPILNYQFKTRLSTYINTIGIDKDKIHVIDRNNIDKALDIIFNKYERE